MRGCECKGVDVRDVGVNIVEKREGDMENRDITSEIHYSSSLNLSGKIGETIQLCQ